MSTLTILTRKSINKDQWVFISPGSLLGRTDWLNNRNNSDDMASFNVFYSETDETFFRIALERPEFLVFFCNLLVNALNLPNLKKHTIQTFSLDKTCQ